MAEYLEAMLNPATGGDNLLSFLLSLIWIGFLMIFFLYPSLGQRMQLSYMLRDLERKLQKLRMIKDEIGNVAVDTVKRVGRPESDPSKELERLSEFFMIQPESMDPYGLVYKLEHILETGETTYEKEVAAIAPHATETQLKTLTNLVEILRGINTLYRVVRHYYLLGKKTSNIYMVLQIQMILPQLLEIAESYRQAAVAFSKGQPIGDGVGVLVAAKLADGAEKTRYEIAKDTIVQELELENRKVYVVRAAGPGGTVGRPGEAVKLLVEKLPQNPKLIITIDAALKLEGEESGKIAEGVGVAIGGPGVDKYKIEELARTRNIPLYAFVVFESITEAITPMRESIAKAADQVLSRVKKLILEKVEGGEVAVVAGIGNTVGVGG
ncbi:MAG: DUF1512 domain-containing protein [Candidatus Caldarchaeum sp.]|nr:DUF1512 domain-containing protein [Candidatus Caldarchaeum sp.]